MRFLLLLVGLLLTTGASAREAVDASAPENLAVTIYRDPERGEDGAMDRNWPKGFAMISETRRVTLPAGETTVRFEGVAEGMVAVSAIVTGLPGGTIEKNRNAALLSPASLVDGALGNRVTITRTNPATGLAKTESAIVRTRADGGLVLQTEAGFEAVRCAGIPEKLTFDRVPEGLSANPVFSIDTRSESGGTFLVTLTYLAWGFDWEASYVARLREARADGAMRMELLSWLTILNDNGQTFPDAELMAVAGKLNVTSDYRELADAPDAPPLQLTCYPFGSTADGSQFGYPAPPPPPPPPAPVMAYEDEAIVVTGSRLSGAQLEAPSPVSVIAAEEALGDLKLFRVPEPVTVSAKGQKQVAFLAKDDVGGRFVYSAQCAIGEPADHLEPARVLLTSVNSKRKGLGQSLPTGAITIYEPTQAGDLLVAETRMRDYALDQDIELELVDSTQVFATCGRAGKESGEGRWNGMRAIVTNANSSQITMRFDLGPSYAFETKGLSRTRVKDGKRIVEITVPGNSRRTVNFRMKPVR